MTAAAADVDCCCLLVDPRRRTILGERYNFLLKYSQMPPQITAHEGVALC